MKDSSGSGDHQLDPGGSGWFVLKDPDGGSSSNF
jgi:hypothetical protein